MNAKEYLMQIRRIDLSIRQKIKEYELRCKSRVLVSGIDYDKDRVQTSPSNVGFTRESEILADMDADIRKSILDLMDRKDKIIGQIQKIDRIEYAEILFKRYVEYKSFKDIMTEMHLSYYRVCHLHGEALLEFSSVFSKVSNF